MPADLVHEITVWLLRHDHPAMILKDAHVTGYDYLIVGDGVLDPASLWWFERMGTTTRRAAAVHEDLHPHDSVRAGAVACASRLAPLAAQMRSELGDRCCLQHWSAVTATHATGAPTHLLEIFDACVNKWTMVRELCRREAIDEQRVAAIGDGLNDVQLLENAGLGIAMANSGPEVTAVAQRITDHHDDDGVAVAIERLLSGEW
jgi:hydroxymethylpyrimidine pyrophosphatase-like HAD family hydrolase